MTGLSQTKSTVYPCRLFVHFGFFSKAVSHCRAHQSSYPYDSYENLYNETLKISWRAQTFFSVGLRALYLFIPLVGWQTNYIKQSPAVT